VSNSTSASFDKGIPQSGRPVTLQHGQCRCKPSTLKTIRHTRSGWLQKLRNTKQRTKTGALPSRSGLDSSAHRSKFYKGDWTVEMNLEPLLSVLQQLHDVSGPCLSGQTRPVMAL